MRSTRTTGISVVKHNRDLTDHDCVPITRIVFEPHRLHELVSTNSHSYPRDNRELVPTEEPRDVHSRRRVNLLFRSRDNSVAGATSIIRCDQRSPGIKVIL